MLYCTVQNGGEERDGKVMLLRLVADATIDLGMQTSLHLFIIEFGVRMVAEMQMAGFVKIKLRWLASWLADWRRWKV